MTLSAACHRPLRLVLAACLSACLAVPPPLIAGGPLIVGGPAFGVSGQPILWDTSQPISYFVDGGPLAAASDGTAIIDNTAGTQLVQAMFQVWEDVPTASIRFANAGTVRAVPGFSDGDVSSPSEFNLVSGDCDAGNQSPILFDANGTVFELLIGDPGVIGFAGACMLDPATGRIVTGLAALNGRFRDGVSSPSSGNYEMTALEFEEVFVHEFGHFLGLDHSQVNLTVQNTPRNCALDALHGLPLMFPLAVCQARKSVGLPILSPDDVAWISRLYPETANSPPAQVPYSNAYGLITGTVLFSDGITPAQGVNVIARQVSDGNPANGDESRRTAFSAVSGFRFTGRVGQNITGNSPASVFGSRDGQDVGTFEIPVLPGSYTVEVESVDPGFAAGSSVGPLSPPIAMPGQPEFWDTAESSTDTPSASSTITVAAAATVSNINIILNSAYPRFDAFESAALRPAPPPLAVLRRDKIIHRLDFEEWYPT